MRNISILSSAVNRTGELSAAAKITGTENKFDITEITDLIEAGDIDNAIHLLKEAGISATVMETDGGSKVVTFKYQNVKYTTYYNPPVDEVTGGNDETEEETHTERQNFDDGSYRLKYIDTKGQMIKDEHYTKDGVLEQWCDYEYDENGVNRKQTVHYADDSYWYVNEFDEKGRNSISYTGQKEGVIDSYDKYEYDENGKLKTMTHMDGNKNVLNTTYYDENEKPVREERWDGTTTVYDYKDDGSEARTTKDVNGQMVTYVEYDSDGRLAKILYYENGEIAETTTCEYDEDGTCTKKTVDSDGKLLTFELRDSKGSMIYSETLKQNSDSSKGISDTDKLLYKFSQGDLSVLDELEELGATVEKDDFGYYTVTFEGKLYNFSEDSEFQRITTEVGNLCSKYSFGLMSKNEFISALKELGAEVTTDADGTIKYELKAGEGSMSGEIENAADGVDNGCMGADYTILKQLGLSDEQIEKYFEREDYDYEYGDGGDKGSYSAYRLKNDIEINGKKISTVTELVKTLNSTPLTDEEKFAMDDLCYKLEQGNTSALELLNAKGIDVDITNGEDITSYTFEYNGKEYTVYAINDSTEYGKFLGKLNELEAKRALGIITLDEYAEALEKLGAKVEKTSSESGSNAIKWSYDNPDDYSTTSAEVEENDDSEIKGVPFDTLRHAGLTNAQIKKYFHSETNAQDFDNYTYTTYTLNENIKINGKEINSIADLVKALSVKINTRITNGKFMPLQFLQETGFTGTFGNFNNSKSLFNQLK